MIWKRALLWLLFCSTSLGIPACSSSGPLEPSSRPQVEIRLQEQQSYLSGSLRGVCGVSEHVAWVSGAGGTYARTPDGGKNWLNSIVPGAEDLDFRDVFAWTTEDAFLMAAGPGEQSRIYLTHDGGRHWTLAYQNPYPEGFFDGMAFWDSDNGIVYGDAVGGELFVIQTQDGGATWTRVPPDLLPPMGEGEHGYAASGTGIALFGDGVWIATGGSQARVFHSPDRGRTWNVRKTPIRSGDPASGIFSLAIGETGLGIAVGGNYQEPELRGENLAISQEGSSWNLLQSTPPLGYQSVIAFLPGSSDRILLASGTSGSHYSLDAGATWQLLESVGYHAIDFGESRDSGWAVGSGGRIAKIIVRETN